MPPARSPLHPDIWLRGLFASRAARDGGVIRRKARDIDRFGYRAYESSGQGLIVCNRAPIRRLR